MPAVLFILHSEHMCRKMAMLNDLGTGSEMLFASLIASQIRGPLNRVPYAKTVHRTVLATLLIFEIKGISQPTGCDQGRCPWNLQAF